MWLTQRGNLCEGCSLTAAERSVEEGIWEWDIPVPISIVQSYVSDGKEKERRNINKLSLNKERNL